MQPQVSIIVPVYNVEKYIYRCVNSILVQTLNEIEVILIDDGSPDHCPAICNEYARKDSRIKVIHKKNGGLSSARNAGIKVATGKYIGFVDSDDWIERQMFSSMVQKAEKFEVDFVMCDYIKKNSNTHIPHSLDIREGYYSKRDLVKSIFPHLIMRECIDYGPLLSVCHCLYLREFLLDKDIYFVEQIKWSEDCLYSAMVGYNASSFYYMKNKFFYNYFYNSNSITTTYKSKAWENYLLMNEKLKEYFQNKKDYDFSRQIKLHLIYFAFSSIGQLRLSNKSFWEKYQEIKKILANNKVKESFQEFTLPKLPMKFKIHVMLLKYRQAFLMAMLQRRVI